ncbi:hypothetical protein ACOMHN_067156 [Nucella lapillus]
MYGDTVYLDCTSSGCKGRAIIKDNQLRLSNQHSHPPLADDYFAIAKAKSVMKRKAEESASSLRDIYDATVRGEGVAGLLTGAMAEWLKHRTSDPKIQMCSPSTGMPLSRRKPRQQLINEDRLRRLEQQLSEDNISAGVFLTNWCLHFYRYANAIGAAGNDTPGDSESDVSEVEQLAEEEHLHVQVQQRQD